MPRRLEPQISCPGCESKNTLEYHPGSLISNFRCTHCGFNKSHLLGIGRWSDPCYAEHRRIERERAKRSRKRVVRLVFGVFIILFVIITLLIMSILGFFLAIAYALTTGDWIPAAIVLVIIAGLLGVTIPAALFTMA